MLWLQYNKSLCLNHVFMTCQSQRHQKCMQSVEEGERPRRSGMKASSAGRGRIFRCGQTMTEPILSSRTCRSLVGELFYFWSEQASISAISHDTKAIASYLIVLTFDTSETGLSQVRGYVEGQEEKWVCSRQEKFCLNEKS